jgi:hypothetical protein
LNPTDPQQTWFSTIDEGGVGDSWRPGSPIPVTAATKK